MFAPANQTHFSLRIENLRHDLQVLAFRGREAISQPFRFDLEQPQWALMTVLIVSQPLSGMVVAKGLFRLLGTLVGTAMSVLMIALFAQAPWLFLLAISLWLGLCTAASTSLRNHVSYAFVLSGYTAGQ